MKRKILIGLFLLCSFISFSQEIRIYRETTGDEIKANKYEIERSTIGYKVRFTSNNIVIEWNLDFSFSCLNYQYKNFIEEIDISATRTGNTINLKGKYKGKAIQKTFNIGSHPWYQSLDFSLENFAASDKSYVKFWVIKTSDMELTEMEASKIGKETVLVNGKRVKAIHVKMNVPGFASLFWHADYWFRESDSCFILYKANRGPGTPLIVIELIR